MEVKVFQLPKRESQTFDRIQDKYAIDGTCVAVADGATHSYKPGFWAEILVKGFLKRPVLTKENFRLFIKEAGEEFNAIKFKLNPDPLIALLEKSSSNKGGHATFLGIKLDERKRQLSFIGYGDCLLIIREKGNVRFYPFQNEEQLRSNKGYLPSKLVSDTAFNEEYICQGTINFLDDTFIYLATDAIGAFLLSNQAEFETVNTWSSFEHFKEYVLGKWENHELEEDDITLLCLNPTGKDKITEFLPPEGFDFKKSVSDKKKEIAPKEVGHETIKSEIPKERLPKKKNGFFGFRLFMFSAWLTSLACNAFFDS